MDPLLVDQKMIAKVLQIDPRRVRQLEKEGILAKHETEGLYYIPDCAQAYYEYKLKPSSNANYDNERALHERAKREKIKHEKADQIQPSLQFLISKPSTPVELRLSKFRNRK